MYLVVIKSHPTYAEIYWNIFPSPPLKPTPPIPQKLVAPFYFQKNMYRWNTLIITSRIICRWTTIKSIMGWATWAATDTSRVRWGFARMIWVWKVTKRSNLISKIFKSYIITLSCIYGNHHWVSRNRWQVVEMQFVAVNLFGPLSRFHLKNCNNLVMNQTWLL